MRVVTRLARPWRCPGRRRCTSWPGRIRRVGAQLVDEGGGDAGPGCADRMTEGDRTAVGVDDRPVEFGPVGEAGQRLRGERLVELDHRRGRPSRCRLGRAPSLAASTGPMPNRCGSTPDTARLTIRAIGSRPHASDARLGRQQQRRRTVVHRRGVPGRDRAVGSEHGP